MSRNPLSNESYTNKDFGSIYTELLDLVKKLTYKWDPTISNESDPGNILLKLNAIIGDKNNYNIDKNILENFPETLTQDISARSLYKQLAYHMPWYQSATTKITFKWQGEEQYDINNIETGVKIPRFQAITDPNNEFVYTTLKSATLTANKSSASVDAVEGILTTLDINGQRVLGLNNLDYNNRIYFNETTVAENYIYVYNYNDQINSPDYEEVGWTMVDNLQIQPLNSKVFEFGVDSRRNICYIEFPSDISTLIQNGLVIQYISTSGSKGNIIARILDRFYKDFSVNINGEDVLLTTDLLQISNESAANNGRDPEDIETAYKNYRRTIGTFNTLVTLRDYMNAIYTSGLVSNVIACDRLNDIQSTFNIVVDDIYSLSQSNVLRKSFVNPNSYRLSLAKLSTVYESNNVPQGIDLYYYNGKQLTTYSGDPSIDFNQIYYVVKEDTEDLKAFDLRLYLLHTPDGGAINTLDDYNSTFEVEQYGKSVYNNVLQFIEEERCIQHNFREILKDIPFLFKNVYPLDIKIIPHYKLGEEQINELKLNINKALFNKINSSQLIFGEEANYNEIYDTIYNADPRIKVLILDDISYTTFATYWDDTQSQFKDVPISEFNSSNITVIDAATEDELKQKIENYSTTLSDYMYKNMYFIHKNNNNEVWRVNNNGKAFKYSTLLNDIRKDVIAKSILSGKTPYAVNDDRFKYALDQNYKLLAAIDKLSTNIEIYPYKAVKNGDIINPTEFNQDTPEIDKLATYTVEPNETVKFMAPSFITKKTFSNYVKYEAVLNNNGKFEKHIEPLSYRDYDINSTYYSNKDIEAPLLDEYQVLHSDKMQSSVDIKITDDILIAIYNLLSGEKIDYLTDNQDGHIDFTLTRKCTFTLTDGEDKVQFVSTLKDLLTSAELTSDCGNYTINTISLENFRVENKSEVVFDDLGNETIFEYQSVSFTPAECSEMISNSEVDGNGRRVINGNILSWYMNYINEEQPEDEPIKVSLNSKLKIADIMVDGRLAYWKSDAITIYTTEYTRNIPANSDYKLQENEHILFFYRTEDKEDSPYIYEKYSTGDIIRPNFTLEGSRIDSAIISNTTSLGTSGKLYYNSNENSLYQKVYNMNQYNDLSGNKSIDIRSINQVILTAKEHHYYFITRDVRLVEGGEYYHYLTPTYNDITKEYEYILANEEYFIYTNRDKTAFEILGEGTLLKFKSNNTLTSSRVDYIDIATKGIDSFRNNCKELDFELTVVEQQLYSFAQGDQITFRYLLENDAIPSSGEKSIYITSNGYTLIDNTKYQIQYISSGGQPEYLPDIILGSSDSIWRATATFNIVTANDSPQTIDNTYVGTDGKEEGKYFARRSLEINGIQYLPETEGTLYLYSDVAINKIGGMNTDISYLDIQSKRNSPYLYLYSLNESVTNQLGTVSQSPHIQIAKPNNDTIQFKIKSVPVNSDPIKIDFKKLSYFKNHNFLLKIYNHSRQFKFKLEVSNDNINYEPLRCVNQSVQDEAYGHGLCYFVFSQEDVQTEYSLRILVYKPKDQYGEYIPSEEVEVQSDTDKITFDSWYRIEYDTIFQEKYGISQEEIDKTLRYYDKDSEFDYAYMVPIEQYIRNPLEAKSFFNVYHPFNQFTIPKGDLYMSSKNKSNINLINNR